MEPHFEAVIDSREHAKTKQLAKMLKLPFIEEGLVSGDFALRKTDERPWKYVAGIERKAIPDLVQSIVSHRLFDQVDRLFKTYPIAFLFVSGSLEEHNKTLGDLGFKINNSVVYGTLTSVIVRTGIHVMWLPNDHILLDMAYRTLEKISQGKYGTPMRRIPKYAEYTPISVMMKVPGISRKKAEMLLKRFKTLENIATAEMSQLQVVDGIGPQVAHLIWKLFHT